MLIIFVGRPQGQLSRAWRAMGRGPNVNPEPKPDAEPKPDPDPGRRSVAGHEADGQLAAVLREARRLSHDDTLHHLIAC